MLTRSAPDIYFSQSAHSINSSSGFRRFSRFTLNSLILVVLNTNDKLLRIVVLWCGGATIFFRQFKLNKNDQISCNWRDNLDYWIQECWTEQANYNRHLRSWWLTGQYWTIPLLLSRSAWIPWSKRVRQFAPWTFHSLQIYASNSAHV